MTKDEIEAGVKHVFVEQFGEEAWTKFRNDPEPFKSMLNPANVGVSEVLDSLDQIEFVMALEEHFHVEIDDVSMALIKTVDDAINTVDTRISRPAHGDR